MIVHLQQHTHENSYYKKDVNYKRIKQQNISLDEIQCAHFFNKIQENNQCQMTVRLTCCNRKQLNRCKVGHARSAGNHGIQEAMSLPMLIQILIFTQMNQSHCRDWTLLIMKMKSATLLETYFSAIILVMTSQTINHC